MAWVLEAIFDWCADYRLDKADRKVPGWAQAAIMALTMALTVAFLWLFLR